jgi:hypothetical protein
LDIALDEVGDALVLAAVEHRHDVRMSDAPGDRRLAVEAAPEHRIPGDVGLDDLQSHMLVPGSHRFVHTAHAPGAHERLDAIRAHELARAQFVRCVSRLGVVLVQRFLSACLGPRLVIEPGEEKSA